MQRQTLALLCLLSSAGCNSGESDRLDIMGTVTFDGRTVSEGVIYFDPDVAKGQDGRQGVAKIVEGTFDTRKAGKGVSGGHYIARLSGFEMNTAKHGRSQANPLFQSYEVEVEVTPEKRVINFDVPREASKNIAPLPNLGI